MESKVESGIECIEMADRLLNQCRKKYLELQEDKKDMSSKELSDNERLLGSQFGLICEYYLKGLLLPYIKLVVPADTPELQAIVDNLTPEQEYKLLIGDKTIKHELSRIYNIPEKKINKLLEQSIKKIGGNGHDLSYFIGTQFMQENKEIKLPLDVRKEIYKGMEIYFIDKFTPKNREEWKNLLMDFYAVHSDSPERTNTHEIAFEKVISDSTVSDAFFSGRYGHLENYIPNLDALYYLANSIRDSIKIQYPNAISIVDRIFVGNIDTRSERYIFPDKNSKIYVFDGKSELTRVYTLENGKDFILKQCGKSSNDDKNEDYDNLEICPEYGVEKIKEITGYKLYKDGLPDISLYPTNLLTMKKGIESVIICERNGQQKGYVYKEGRIIEVNDEIVQEYNRLIDNYEAERRSGKYDEETQTIRENFSDRRDIMEKKFKVRHDDENLENRFEPQKLNTVKELEGRLNERELLEAYEDKNGIGRELLYKMKKPYMDRGEK